jgi:hypothetical protein
VFIFRKQALRSGADKSFAQQTSHRRSKELLVSLERGICSLSESQFFSFTEAEKKHFIQQAQPQQHCDRNCYRVFFTARQGAGGNSIQTLQDHAPSYGTVKNCVDQFKRPPRRYHFVVSNGAIKVYSPNITHSATSKDEVNFLVVT